MNNPNHGNVLCSNFYSFIFHMRLNSFKDWHLILDLPS